MKAFKTQETKDKKSRRNSLLKRSLRPSVEHLEERLVLSALVVNSAADNTTDTSVLTLRDAITLLNNGGNPTSLDQASMPARWASQITGSFGSNDRIEFNIPTTDPGYDSVTRTFAIQPASQLPDVTVPVTIDGYTQPDATPNTLAVGDNAVLKVQLVGAPADPSTLNSNGYPVAPLMNGLVLDGGNSTVRGLVIQQFTGAAITLNTQGGDDVQGNFIGTNATGTVGLGNGLHNVVVSSNGNVIGSTGVAGDFAERNVIAGNATGAGVYIAGYAGDSSYNVIAVNLIGPDATGTKQVSNPNVSYGGNTYGVSVSYGATGNIIGADSSGVANTSTRNIISGNATDGIVTLSDQDTVIKGNYVGTDVTGTKALGNGAGGVVLQQGTEVVGGPSASDRNIISGNGNYELLGFATVHTVVQGNYIGADVTGLYAIQALPSCTWGVFDQGD